MWQFHCDPPSQWNFRSPISKERGCPLPIQCECSKNLSSLCPWAPPSVTIGAATFPCSSYTTAVSPLFPWISPSHSPVEEARGCLVRRPSKKTESDSTQICKLTNTQKYKYHQKSLKVSATACQLTAKNETVNIIASIIVAGTLGHIQSFTFIDLKIKFPKNGRFFSLKPKSKYGKVFPDPVKDCRWLGNVTLCLLSNTHPKIYTQTLFSLWPRWIPVWVI